MKVWGLIVEPDFKAVGRPFPVEVKSSDSINGVKIKARRVSKKVLGDLELWEITVWKAQGDLQDLMETLKSIDSNAPSSNTMVQVFEDRVVGALGITENQILLLQTNSRTSRISTAPETLFDNPVHKGVS